MDKLTAAGVTAITDFMLACEVFFLAGWTAARPKARFSAAWFWAGTLLLLGLGALIGGIDHGFFEPANFGFDPQRWPRYFIQRANWMVLGAMTFCLLMATAKQFFPPAVQRVVAIVGIVQFAIDTAAVLLVDSFLDVILNYAPVIVLLLAMNVRGLKDRSGSWPMIAGILIQFLASAIQAMGVDALSPLDHNGLYHVVSMVGVAYLYLGGKRLKP
ncbi:conserved membrane hypothetical protein [Candidatus Sulfopaludibacter sp. SbA6]|nr:conserved membrane hypothetical protein [Candidatus Sulfopaludibacter sp. SbA6]